MLIKKILPIISLILLPALSAAEDINVGKSKSTTCTACHGANGISPNPIWPNLAGQQKDYLIKQLKDFKSGARKDPIMSPMVQTLSDEDMTNISAYYSSLK